MSNLAPPQPLDVPSHAGTPIIVTHGLNHLRPVSKHHRCLHTSLCFLAHNIYQLSRSYNVNGISSLRSDKQSKQEDHLPLILPAIFYS